MTNLNEIRTARAGWTKLAEPSDPAAIALIDAYGPVEALDIALGDSSARGLTLAVTDLQLQRALARWSPRGRDFNIRQTLLNSTHSGIGFLVPEDPEWPAALNELAGAGKEPVIGLWYRGNVDALSMRSVFIGGSRDATNYGVSVASEFGQGLARVGAGLVTGNAYGVEAAAAKGALASSGTVIMVQAAGVDRAYPAGNSDLVEDVVAAGGLLLSEIAPGSAPTRWRFQARNRLVAALSVATVSVEARTRSGILNSASHAKALGRPVGAVPGSVYSANSEGNHMLIREHGAVCITSVEDVFKLADIRR